MPSHLQSPIRFSQAQISLAGRKHLNDDSLGFVVPEANLLITKGACAVIADGLSSAEAGGEAAELCVTEFLQDYFDTPEIWTVKRSAQKVLSSINRSLYSRSNEYLESRGWLTTLSVLILKSHTAHIFHVGDSRIYRIRGQHMECLTTDHTSSVARSKNCLARAMGMDTRLDLDYRSLAIETDDVFLLTTDGIHDYLDSKTVLACIDAEDDLQTVCKRFSDMAYAEGSPDNLSCQLIRIDELVKHQIDDLTERLTLLPFPPDLSPGMRIDGYEVIDEIYASSRSQLYLVEDESNQQRWVMKTPSPNYHDDPAYIERFIMEEWVGSRIDSPHVVKVVPTRDTKSFLYYLMEQVEGISLETWIEKNPYPRPSMAIKLVKQIAKGLSAFHKRETLHQDLKPSNIIVGDDLHVTLVDFGSVFVAGVDEIFIPLEREKILGTAQYADPLLRLGQSTGIQGDIFSLATITYEIFTHHLAYANALENCDTPAQIDKLRYIPAVRYNPVVPPWFDHALRKGMAVESRQRYLSLNDFMKDLTQPNPDFVNGIEPHPTSNKVIFWQIMSMIWFTISMFLIAAIWVV